MQIETGFDRDTRTTDVPATSDASEPAATRPAETKTFSQLDGGFLYQWGPQAWIDMWMSHSMIVRQAWPLVDYTFLPILRLSADPDEIDRGYAEIRSRREKIRLFDSPRERWRKNYGSFVREAEWALLELRKHFSQEQYEDIVIGTSVKLAKYNSTSFLEMMNGLGDANPPKKKKPGAANSTKPTRWQTMIFDMFNPAGFLTGPAEVTEIDAENGSATLFVPDCAWHICADGESLPNPDALPEQGCLLICKGAFEALFDGEQAGVKMEFEPHLPETSCTVRASWKVKS